MVDGLRQRLRRVVLDSDTRAGRIYNLVIFGTILLSVAGLLVEPHPMRLAAPGEIPAWVASLERGCLLVFMADYLLHLWVSPRPLVYARSFYGLIDASAVVFFFVPQISSGLVLWIFKFGRVLRVFKLLRFLDEAQLLGRALKASARRIGVFLFFVVLAQVVLGYLMVVFESGHPNTQFQTVGQGVYWAIDDDHRGLRRFCPSDGAGPVAWAIDAAGFRICHPHRHRHGGNHATGAAGPARLRHLRHADHRREASHCDRCGALLPIRKR